MYNAKQKALILINMADISINRKNALAARLTDIELLTVNLSDLKSQIIGITDEKTYLQFEELEKSNALAKELLEIAKLGVQIVTLSDESYPECLSEINPSPIVLYCLGDISLLKASKKIAIVGTRTPSRYGMEVTKMFSEELSMNGFIIVSGMARGIDAIAHKGCIDSKKPTIAVLGSGVDVVYPADNFNIYNYIKENGLIISEYSLHSEALKYHFPERNRIISGLSDGLLVTEAGEKSGSLITLNLALDQGKEVFLIPSNITNKYARGTNQAIKDGKGMCVTDVNDIYFAYKVDTKYEKREVTGLQLDITEQMIQTVLEVGDLHFEELLQITHLKVSELTAILTKLELLGIVCKTAGNNYTLGIR